MRNENKAVSLQDKRLIMKIFCLGMNYPVHNKILHGTLNKPEEPVIFCKPDSALLKSGKPFFIPDDLGRIEYEGELVVRICRLGKSIPERFAHRYYDAVTVGVDFTARELQVPIFRGGQLVYQKPALDDIRAYCADQLTTLWPEVLRFDYPHNYYVDLSEKLLKIKLDLLNAGGKSQG